MRSLPWLLVLTRLALAPLLVVANAAGVLSDRGVLVAYLVAFTTDYFDGVIARRLGVATARLREADGAVDTVFHVALAWVTWQRHASELKAHAGILEVFLGTTLVWYVLDAFRWRRAAGFHALSAKAFSVAVGVWVVALYGGLGTGVLLPIALAVGVVANVEGVAISLLLREPESDVRHLGHALRLRACHSKRVHDGKNYGLQIRHS